ncbi:hypothetical protein [Enterovibrio calviensis]|uniref:hypothetical protein n=1 Tax=Enterovibrio calviensis TaxID=91359 RepID=UPI00047F06FC|nr:hypothetical protein [Enterovibrio calviensis]
MNKEAFLSFGIKHQKVTIESIGSEVFVRPMSYAATAAMSLCATVQDRFLVAAVFGLVDEDGKQLFTLEGKDELSTAMPMAVIQEIAVKVIEISSIGSDSLVK